MKYLQSRTILFFKKSYLFKRKVKQKKVSAKQCNLVFFKKSYHLRRETISCAIAPHVEMIPLEHAAKAKD
jgi:hypothetical protein